MNCTCTMYMYIEYTWLSLQVRHQLMKECVASMIGVCAYRSTQTHC